MKKFMFAMLSLVCLFAISTGAEARQPAPAVPSAPQIGGCRWFCDGNPKAFIKQADCQAVCSTACEQIC